MTILLPLRFDFVKGTTTLIVPRAAARERLPAAHDRIDVNGIEFHSEAASAGAFGGDHCASAAQKSVKDNVVAGRAVHDRIGNHRNWLYSRVKRKKIALSAGARECIRARIFPEIGAVPAKTTQFDIVGICGASGFEDGDQFVLTSVEASHAGVVFRPYAQVLELAIRITAGEGHLEQVPP